MGGCLGNLWLQDMKCVACWTHTELFQPDFSLMPLVSKLHAYVGACVPAVPHLCMSHATY